jgi:hypothetical protein
MLKAVAAFEEVTVDQSHGRLVRDHVRLSAKVSQDLAVCGV